MQTPGMNSEQLAKYAKEIEGWTMIQLLEGRAGWKPDAAAWQVVDREIRRRDERGTRFLATAAFGVSVVSLIVAILKH